VCSTAVLPLARKVDTPGASRVAMRLRARHPVRGRRKGREGKRGGRQAGGGAAAAGPGVLAGFDRALDCSTTPVAGRGDRLRAVLEEGQSDPGLRDRARAYLRICEVQLAPRPPAPVGAGELYDLGVLRLNAGYCRRRSTCSRGAALDPRSDKIEYALATASP